MALDNKGLFGGLTSVIAFIASCSPTAQETQRSAKEGEPTYQPDDARVEGGLISGVDEIGEMGIL